MLRAGHERSVPSGYTPRANETRIVFIHGDNVGTSALGPYYAGFTSRLANWTGLPVFAFDYATEPIVPWPQNLRSVLAFIEYACDHLPPLEIPLLPSNSAKVMVPSLMVARGAST